MQLAHIEEQRPLAIGDAPQPPGEQAAAQQAADVVMYYDPGIVPPPVMLPNGDTLYPGETTVHHSPAQVSGVIFAADTANAASPARQRPAQPA